MIGHLLQQPGMHVKPCLGKMMQKIYQDLFDRKNSKKVGKNQIHKDSVQSIKDSQLSLAQGLVTFWSPPLLCPSLNKGQITIQLRLDQAMSNDIHRSYNVQLEMAIENFFH